MRRGREGGREGEGRREGGREGGRGREGEGEGGREGGKMMRSVEKEDGKGKRLFLETSSPCLVTLPLFEEFAAHIHVHVRTVQLHSSHFIHPYSRVAISTMVT